MRRKAKFNPAVPCLIIDLVSQPHRGGGVGLIQQVKFIFVSENIIVFWKEQNVCHKLVLTSLNVAQGQKYGALSKIQTHYQ